MAKSAKNVAASTSGFLVIISESDRMVSSENNLCHDARGTYSAKNRLAAHKSLVFSSVLFDDLASIPAARSGLCIIAARCAGS